MLRSYPHGEDPDATAGGDSSADGLPQARGKPVAFRAGAALGNSPATPPGEGKHFNRHAGVKSFVGGDSRETAFEGDDPADDEIENEAQEDAEGVPDGPNPDDIPFLRLVREAEDQALLYVAQVNRRAWTQAYRAAHNEHFTGSKYLRAEYRNRTKLFRPKTRSAMRKDMAAVAASMFGSVNPIDCSPGDDGDPQQRAAAAVMKELINYRTKGTSGKASIPWMQVALGARNDALLTGICLTKQSWKLDLRRQPKPEQVTIQDEQGNDVQAERDVYVPYVDRPDCQLIPPENFVISPAADWTDPIQTAQYVILKWPMTIDEVKEKQQSPRNPWNDVEDSTLRAAGTESSVDMSSLRRAREMGLDRYDETQTGTKFQVIWVYEVFMKVGDTDWTFFSVSDRAFLTDPKPVTEVYPEQAGSRPLAMGYGALESHRIFPMSPVESWQPLQLEINDLANLTLDAIKQNVMPVTKIVRGRQIDIDQVRRRSSGSSIIVTNKDDVTWERPPDIPQSVPMMNRELEVEFDDLAGQFNGGTTENNNSLSRTLGGLKLVAGSANAVQEYDIRIWITTWAEPALAQIVRLEQYYESDPIVLGLCGQRAQLFQKHGVDKITDDLLDQEVTITVSVGLGAGDPQQRLQKFSTATQIVAPLLAQTEEFKSGQVTINWEEVVAEVYGAAGFGDAGKRFFKQGNPQHNPLQDLQAEKLKADIEKARGQGKGAMLSGLAQVAKVALGNRELEAESANNLLGHHMEALRTGFEHGHRHNEQMLSAADHGSRHGLAVRGQQHQEQTAEHQHAADMMDAAMQQQAPAAEAGGGDEGGGGAPAPAAPAPAPRPTRFDFKRDPRTGQILSVIPIYGDTKIATPPPQQPLPLPPSA